MGPFGGGPTAGRRLVIAGRQLMVRGCPLFGLLLVVSLLLGAFAAPSERGAGPGTVLASPLALEAAIATASSTEPRPPAVGQAGALLTSPGGTPLTAPGARMAGGPVTAQV